MNRCSLIFLLLVFLIPTITLAEEWWEDEEEERIPIITRVIFGVRSRALEEQEQRHNSLSRSQGGILLTDVESGSPAAGAGMQDGDVLLVINGETFHTPADLQLFLSKQKPGQVLHAVLLRNGKNVFCSATLRARPQPVVVGYARPVNRTIKGVSKYILNLQCHLAYHLAQCPHNRRGAIQCVADIRRFMAISNHAPLRLSYRDSHGPIIIDCHDSYFSIRTGNRSLQLSSPSDELPPTLRDRLRLLSQKN